MRSSGWGSLSTRPPPARPHGSCWTQTTGGTESDMARQRVTSPGETPWNTDPSPTASDQPSQCRAIQAPTLSHTYRSEAEPKSSKVPGSGSPRMGYPGPHSAAGPQPAAHAPTRASSAWHSCGTMGKHHFHRPQPHQRGSATPVRPVPWDQGTVSWNSWKHMPQQTPTQHRRGLLTMRPRRAGAGRPAGHGRSRAGLCPSTGGMEVKGLGGGWGLEQPLAQPQPCLVTGVRDSHPATQPP